MTLNVQPRLCNHVQSCRRVELYDLKLVVESSTWQDRHTSHQSASKVLRSRTDGKILSHRQNDLSCGKKHHMSRQRNRLRI